MQLSNLKTSKQQGFSLIEILVGLVIGMFGVMVVLQTMSYSESQKRTTTSGADAQSSGMVSLMMMERDLLNAGFGSSDIDCTVINAFNEDFTPQEFTFSSLPVLITVATPTAYTDKITISKSNSSLGGIPVTIQKEMPDSSAILNVNYGQSFKAGDLILISEPPKDCSIAQLTQDGQATGQANVNPSVGTQWNLQHNPTSVWNPPGGQNIFPTGGYGIGATVLNMGNFEVIEYYVENNNLMRKDNLQSTVAGSNPRIVANGVIALKALYGRDTNNDGYADEYVETQPVTNKEVVSVRIGILVQGLQYSKEPAASSPILLWKEGVASEPAKINLTEEQMHYRYRVYTSIVPLRNVIWNN